MTRSTILGAGAALLMLGLMARPGVFVAQEGSHAESKQDHSHAAEPASAGGSGTDAASQADEEAGPPALPETNELIDIRVHEATRELEIVIGPVSLPAGAAHLRPPVQLAELGIEGWMHGFSWDIRDADGSVLPERLLHHVNVIDPDSRELFSGTPRRIMAAGRETKGESLPGLLGYPLQAKTRVLVSAMFASLPDQSFDRAYLHITLTYTPSDDPGWLGPWNVYPFYLDVMGPVGEKEFPLPPGTHGMSWEGSPAIDGRILGIGGHLHDYGDWIRLEDVTTGKILWQSEPELDENGRTISVPTSKLWWRGGVKIRKDHVYRISVQYTNPLDTNAADGAMGAIGGVILAANAQWPEFSREDPDYVQDLRNTLEKPNEAHAHGAMEGMDIEGADMMDMEAGGAEEDEGAEHEHDPGGPL